MDKILFFLIPGWLAIIGWNSITRSKVGTGYILLFKLAVSNLIVYLSAILTFDEIGYVFYDYTSALKKSDFLHEFKYLEGAFPQTLEYLFKIYPYAVIISLAYTVFALKHELLLIDSAEKKSWLAVFIKPWNILLHAFRKLHHLNDDPLTDFYIRNTQSKVVLQTQDNIYLCNVLDWGSKDGESTIGIDVHIVGTESLSEPTAHFNPPQRGVIPTSRIIGYYKFSGRLF